MSFLTIPNQEGLFSAIKTVKSAEETECKSPVDDDDEDDDDDDTENVRLIPRCSPLPRKRGQSIFDETAEYMRIQLAMPAGRRRVSFADTTGGDLVDVKEFVAFDSDEEENSAAWEEEEAKYRHPQREPTYHVKPEFHVPTGSALAQAVLTNKLEVELLTPVEHEPLAVSGIIRVLNISFHKAVYIRSTMDNWATYYDHPAEYVQGSHDGDTDKFSFKLSFAPPYNTHGSRIEFVVRYETSHGDYWANNSHMNYVVTLLLSYEDESAQSNADMREIRGILKPPKVHSMDDDSDYDYEEELDRDEDNPGTCRPEPLHPTPVCPVIVHPEIDIEIADRPSGSPLPPNRELPSVDDTLSTTTVSPGERFPCVSSETTFQPIDEGLSFVLQASKPIQPNKSQSLPRPHCESGSQISEQPKDSSPSTLLPASSPSLPLLPVCCTRIATESEEQKKGSSTLSDSEQLTVTNPYITGFQANLYLDGNIAKQSLFPVTLEDEKMEVEQVPVEEKKSLKQEEEDRVTEEGLNLSSMTQEPPDYTINPIEQLSGVDLHEDKTKSISQTEISPVCPAFFEKQTSLADAEADPDPGFLQTDSKVRFSQAFGEEVGIPDIFFPSTTNTLPTATVILGEQSYVSSKSKSQTTDEELFIAYQCSKPLETTEPSLAEMAMGSVEEYESLKQEQDSSIQVKRPLTITGSFSEECSETSPPIEISPRFSLSSTEVCEKQVSVDHTDVASLESDEGVLLARATLDISQVNENTEEEKDSIQVQESSSISLLVSPAESSSQVEISSVPPSYPEEPTTQKLLDDTAARYIQSDAVDPLTKTRPRLDSSQAGGEEIPYLVASCVWLPTTEKIPGPAGEGRVSHSLASHQSFPSMTSQCFKRRVVVGLSEMAAGVTEDSTRSAQHNENSTPALLSPVVESQVSLGAEGEAAPSPALTDSSVNTSTTEVSQNVALNSIQARKEEVDSLQVSPDTLLENLPNPLSEVAQPLNPESEHGVQRSLMPSIVFLGGVIFFSVVLQEPSALLLMGLIFFLMLCF